MPFIPHTDEDLAAMLAVIGAESIDDLFDEIPPGLLGCDLSQIPRALSEMDIGRIMLSNTYRRQHSPCPTSIFSTRSIAVAHASR